MNKKYFSPEHPVPWRYEMREYDCGNGTAYCYYITDATGAWIDTIYDEQDIAICLVEFSKAKHRLASYESVRTREEIEAKKKKLDEKTTNKAHEALVLSRASRLLAWVLGKDDLDENL